jgi:hypothetical protein
MDWRLDVEIARRNLSNGSVNPKFMLRVDFTNEDHSSLSSNASALSANSSSLSRLSGAAVASSEIESLHLEADYANMKNIQRELELALQQLNSAHCQRFAKYIS